jgi:hypothetical protein
MTVGELIILLEQCDQSAEVVSFNREYGFYYLAYVVNAPGGKLEKHADWNSQEGKPRPKRIVEIS